VRLVLYDQVRGTPASHPTLLSRLGCVAGIAMVLLCGLAGPAFAACTKAIGITETQQMKYGTIAVTSGGGTVRMTAGGTVSGPAGFVFSGAVAAGSFHVTGSNNCAVVISFVAGSLIGPGAAMTIGNFTTNAAATPTLRNGGILDFNVGADLAVNAGQAGGNYLGAYTVTVIY
jgi:Domain of unknown function (DUF4402)